MVVRVPIGCNGDVTEELARRGLRGEAFPFDGMVSMISEITRCVREDFAGFCEGYREATSGGRRYVSFPRYRMVSLNEDASKVEEEYGRRIRRFREVMSSSSSRVIFYADRDTSSNARNVGLCEGYDKDFVTPSCDVYETQVREFERCIWTLYPRLKFKVVRV